MTTDDFCLCNKTYVPLAQGLELATNRCTLFSDDIDHVINTCGGCLQYLVFFNNIVINVIYRKNTAVLPYYNRISLS